MIPDGWFYQNQVAICRMYETALTLADPVAHRVFGNRVKELSNAEAEVHEEFGPYSMFAEMLFPAVSKFVIKAAFAQTAIDQAMLACALERHRLVHGSFPETLAELSPKFIEKIPHDIMNGQPLKYRRTDDGKFILYSVGWNETDDGGTVALSSNGRSHRTEEGDWVWQYSTNFLDAKASEPRSDSP